ncbi:DcaP family trimeric outer membrane transporter [Roseomonas sp. AR75]|uniref:DcaP family trimeric outer membrane transporter n=1 Tax=Roseomonas sp. AR75 TaxID=2562311 RepID=UPI0010C02A35|nr:DcaP family trimeric outer membrane transporter [Roseomonas sp. AR75]
MRSAPSLRGSAAPRGAFLCSVAVLGGTLVFGGQAPAFAQTGDIEALQRQLQQMQQQMDAMRAQLRDLQAQQAQQARETGPVRRPPAPARSRVEPAAPRIAVPPQGSATPAAAAAAPTRPPPTSPAASTVPPGRLADSIAIPGTDGRVRVRLSGFVKVNAQYDFDGRYNSDSVTTPSIPLANASTANQDGNLQVSARRSRIRFESEVETGWTGDWRFSNQVVEFDFAGSDASTSDVGTSNSYEPRLRLAYVTLGPVMIGQNDSLYLFPPEAQAERLDDGTFLGTSNVRQVGLRYTANLAAGLTGAVALESPYSDVTSTATTNISNDNGQGSFVGSNNVPDLLAALDYRQAWGGLAARGVARQIKVDNQAASVASQRFTEEVFGWGAGLGGWVEMGRMIGALEGDRLFAVANYGRGIGRYLDGTANGYGATTSFGLPGTAPQDSVLDAVGVTSGMVGYRRAWSSTVRSNIVASLARYDYASYVRGFAGTAGNTNRQATEFSVNLIWSPLPWIDAGIEYIYANRDVLNPAVVGAYGGTVSRIQASFIGRF